MARTANPTTEPTPDVALDEARLLQVQHVMSQAQSEYAAERDLVNQLLGQAQMGDALAKFSVTVTTSKLAYVKENKLYRALKGQKSDNGDQFLTGTWEEFCDQLGRSREHVDRDIANIKAFGEEALESMSKMGIGYRELRQYRRLEGDQRQALITAAEAGDKEGLLDLAEELLAKVDKEKAILQKKLDETTADYDAQSDVLATKNQKIDDISRELRKAQRRIAEMPINEAMAEIRHEMSQAAYRAEVVVRADLHAGIEALVAAGQRDDSAVFLDNTIRQLEMACQELREQYGISSTTAIPAFLRPDAEEQVAAALAQARLENGNDAIQ